MIKYWTVGAIWLWFILLVSLMYWQFTDETAWGAPLAYSFILVVHFALYRSKRDRQYSKLNSEDVEKNRDKYYYDEDRIKPRFGNPISGWYRKFAYVPVWTVDRGYIWMRPYWRRRIAKFPFLDGGPDYWFQKVVTFEPFKRN